MQYYTLFTLLFGTFTLLNAQEWERQHPFEDLRDALDVAMAPNGFGVVVGEEGLIRQTHDFGATWAYPSETFNGIYREAKTAINADDTYTVWVAGTDLLRSSDEGANWEEIDYPAGFGNAVYLNVLSPWFLYVGNSQKLQKTNDGGETWTEVTPENIGNLTNIFFLDEMHGWVGDRIGQVHITQDGGETWTVATIDAGIEKNVEPLFIDELNGYASLHRSFYQTSDGGLTWTLLADNVFGNYTDDMAFTDASGQGIVATAFGTRVSRSMDGGQTWQSTGLGGMILNGLEALPDGKVWVSGNFQSLHYSSGPTLLYEDLFPGVKEGLLEIEFFDFDQGWALGSGAVLKTMDGGANWEQVNTSEASGENDFRQVFIRSAAEVWLVGLKEILKTVDGGDTWEFVFEIPENNFELGLEYASGGIIATAGNGRFYRTMDDGATWEVIEVDGLEKLKDLDFLDDETGMAVGAQGSIAKTTDGGASWVKMDSDMPLNANLLHIQMLSTDTAWAVSRALDNHIWKTVDGGESWVSYSLEPSAYLTGIHFVNDTLGYVYGGSSAFGRVYRTIDGGETWAVDYAITPQINSLAFKASEAGTRMWIAGAGGNIERLEMLNPVVSSSHIEVSPFDVVPNPTAGLLYLQLPQGLSAEARLYLYNAAGQRLLEQAVTSELRINHLEAGLYLLEIRDQRKIFQSRVVKAGY